MPRKPATRGPETIEIVCCLVPDNAKIFASVGIVTKDKPVAVPADEAKLYIRRKQAIRYEDALTNDELE